LDERTGRVDAEAQQTYSFPLPSSYGPYGLSRLAVETGGRYFLWSWNRTGRSNIVYDESRCDAFPPDLRDRETIRREASQRLLARAILKAWSEVACREVHVARTTPALTPGGAPQTMAEPPSESFMGYAWPTPGDRASMVGHARVAVAALDRAIGYLDVALAAARPPLDAIDRRYAADADLLRHTLLVHRFTIGEALLVAEKEVPADAWKNSSLQPGLTPQTAIHGGSAALSTTIDEHAPIRNRNLCVRVKEDRMRMLETYAGTPHGELIARNRVQTMLFHLSPLGTDPGGRKSPADSSVNRGTTGPGSAPPTPSTTGGR
ncbi:MAG TPA: hypothetical protein PKA37_06030, partial [Planctomycetota bacterium]|nr:hypothetical protein [Planctomycetota bacterium]